MRRSNSTENLRYLLREYVKESLLVEDEGGGGESSGSSGGGDSSSSALSMGMGGAITPQQSGMGGIYLNSGTLATIFGNPFKRVLKTIAGKSKEVLASIKMFVRLSFEAVVSTLVPFLEAEYGKIFDDEESEIKKLRTEYKDVYEATNKVFQNDASVFAFFAAPGPMVAAMTLKKGPDAAVGALKTLDSFTGGALGWMWGHAEKRNPFDFKRKSLDLSSYRRGGKFIFEDEEKPSKEGPKEKLKDKKSLQKIAKSLEDSQKLQAAKKEFIAANRNTMKKCYEAAEELSKAKTLEDLQKLTGKKIDLMNVIDKKTPKQESRFYRKSFLFEEENSGQQMGGQKTAPEKKQDPQKASDTIKNMDPSERAAMEKEMLAHLRESLARAYVLPIQKRIDAAKASGATDDNLFVIDCQKTLSAIKKLMGKT